MDASVASANGAVPAKAPAPQTATASDPHALSPLPVPWLRHDNFMTVKKLCTADGLMQAKKHSVVRVLQELKKGRTHLQQQLSQMELQLLHVSDFMRDVVDKLEIVPPDAAIGGVAAGDSKNGVANGAGGLNGVHGKGKTVSTSDKTNPLNPVAVLVEEDLASETPCTTVGLWRYLSCFAFFKNVTLEDMQEALLLEDADSALVVEGLNEEGDSSAIHAFDRVDALPTLEEMPEKDLDGGNWAEAHVNEILRMRLLAAMIPGGEVGSENAKPELQENGTIGHKEDLLEGADVEMKSPIDVETASQTGMLNGVADVEMKRVQEDLLPQFEPCRTLQQLRDIGLVEDSTEAVVQSLQHPQDDEVNREIRLLEAELVTHVRRNNEFKRTLRRSLERLKPWLTHDEEIQQVEAKFLKMWRRKKELQRKKKHKVKKQMRKSAFVMPPPVSTLE